MNWNLSGATTPGQGGPGNNDNEEVFCIPQSSRTGVAAWVGLISNPGYSLGEGSYNSSEMRSVYSTGPADWAQIYTISSIPI